MRSRHVAGRLDASLVAVTLACTLLPVLVTLDATVVNVAQRTFVDQFRSTQAVVAWTATGYSLALAAAIPVTGWAAGRWGTKVLALGSVTLFSWASLLCAQAPNVAMLVGFRALQGLAGGTLMPLQLIILAQAAGPQRLARVLTISMVPILTAPICGPILGGWLIDSFGWQWVFMINVPIGLVTLVFAGLVLPEGVPSPGKPFDAIGAMLLSPGLVLLLYGVSRMPERASIADARVWMPAACGAILLGAFVVHALRRPERALINLRLLRNRYVAVANAIRFLFAVSFFGCCMLFPAYFQQALSMTPLQSGLLLIPQTLGAAAVMPMVGRLMVRQGPRRVVLAGTILAVTGLAVFVGGIGGRVPVLMGGLALFGVGSGCMMTPVSWSAVHTLSQGDVPCGATLFNVNHYLAASVGGALMSVVLTSRYRGVTGDVPHAYAGAFLVAVALLASIAVPASFLPSRAA